MDTNNTAAWKVIATHQMGSAVTTKRPFSAWKGDRFCLTTARGRIRKFATEADAQAAIAEFEASNTGVAP
jgi:hypothetical protein